MSDGSTVITDDDYSNFIEKNADVYIMKFKAFQTGGVDSFKATWHWPAFFIPIIWLFYRKFYNRALSLYVCCLFLVLFLPFVSGEIVTSIVVILSAMHITAGVSANYIYYKRATEKIIQIKRLPKPLRNAELARTGGVNNAAAWICGILLFLFAWGFISVFVEYQKRGYASTLNTDCKNAYTAAIAFGVDNPGSQNISLDQLQQGGYSQTAGVTTTPYNLSEFSGTITCKGPA